MRIYSNETGDIIRILQDAIDDTLYGPPPAFAFTLEVDATTNPELVAYLNNAVNDVRLINDVITYNGNPLTINAPGAAWLQRKIRENAESQAQAIPGWASWTEAQALDWLLNNAENPLAAIPEISTMTTTAFNSNAKSINAQFQDVLQAQQQVIHSLIRMVIALRNAQWPNLQE